MAVGDWGPDMTAWKAIPRWLAFAFLGCGGWRWVAVGDWGLDVTAWKAIPRWRHLGRSRGFGRPAVISS